MARRHVGPRGQGSRDRADDDGCPLGGTKIQARLRWHLYELFPGLVIRPRALSQRHVLDVLTERVAVVDSTVGLIAREPVVRCLATH